MVGEKKTSNIYMCQRVFFQPPAATGSALEATRRRAPAAWRSAGNSWGPGAPAATSDGDLPHTTRGAPVEKCVQLVNITSISPGFPILITCKLITIVYHS